MVRQKRHRPLKRWVRFIISLIIIFTIAIGIICIIDANDTGEQKQTITVSYNSTPSVDYKVYLLDNDYIKEEYLGKEQSYISDLVKNIVFNFNYDFNISKKSYVKYDYSIKGKLLGTYESSSENQTANLWNNEFDFIDKTQELYNTSDVNISEELIYDYPAFNDKVSSFKQDLSVPIVAYMELTFNINLYANAESNDISESQTQVIKIPLNQVAFSIVEDIPEGINKSIVDTTPQKERDLIKQNIGLTLDIIGIIIFVAMFKKLFNIRPKNYYTQEITRLMKSYGDVIIELVNGINEEDMDIVLVKSFNELLDLEEELRVPINFIETYPNYEGEFTIVNNNIIYKYVLKNEQ